jgi:hypothetical protein
MMIPRTAIACLALAACAPQTKTPEAPPPVDQFADEGAPFLAAPEDGAKYKEAPAGEITVQTPLADARVASPLIAEGSAINTWFFEGQFVAEIVVEGEVIASAPAIQAGETSWTDPGPVGFKAELAFEVTREQKAELILSEDMPEMINPNTDERGPARSVRIPIVLSPPAK